MRNEVNCIRLASTNSTYYYILDDDYKLTVLDKRKIKNIYDRSDIKNVDREGNNIDSRPEVSKRRYGNNRNSNGRNGNRRTTGINDKLIEETISSERGSNERRYSETDFDDFKRNGKSSKTVNDNIADLKRENKKLKEANELLRHEFELTGELETSLSSATNIGSYDTIYDKSNLTKKDLVQKHQVFNFKDYYFSSGA